MNDWMLIYLLGEASSLLSFDSAVGLCVVFRNG
jgi:hypothetical protein